MSIDAALPPPGVTTLAELADPPQWSAAVTRVAQHAALPRRAAVFTVLHQALGAVGDAIIGPLVRRGEVVALEAGELGVRLAPADPPQCWAAATTRPRPGFDPAAAGHRWAALIDPILVSTGGEPGLRPWVVRRLAAESLQRCCARHERAVLHRDGALRHAGWLAEFFGAAGLPQPWTRTITVQIDAGGPLSLPRPELCCVLARTVEDSACPTCPRYPDDATRHRETQRWLCSVDDTDFVRVVGRARAG